jgi:hypothetical protein
MSRFLFVSWDGGGNQLPARRIAAELDTRGHHTRWLMLPRKAIDMATVSPAERGAITLGQIMANPAHLAELRADLDRAPADMLVIDCLLFGALAAAQLLGVPAACLVHTVPGAFGGPHPGNPYAQPFLTAINSMRAALGLAQISDPWQTWSPHTPIVASVAELDTPPATQVREFNWVGPLTDRPPAGHRTATTPARPPRVLVSLSTARANTRLEQPKAQRILDALAGLGCRAELTGPALDTERLRVPGNATVYGHRPHGQVMSDVSLTITHGGHGTVCTSLAHGVPLLCLPNPVADQPYLASRITSLGAGLGLSHDADPDQIRTAAESILRDPCYTEAAARLQAAILATPGVPGAASTLESLSPRAPSPRCAR